METRAAFKVAWLGDPDFSYDDGEIYYEDLNRAIEQVEAMTGNAPMARYYVSVSLFVLILKRGVSVTTILNGNESQFLEASVLLKDWSR